MSRMGSSDKSRPKYRLEITEDRPEDDPRRLAIQLAEALTARSTHEYDAGTFKTSSQAERAKATQLQQVIFQLKEREKNPPVKVRRMDPLSEYDLKMCEEELAVYKERAQELQQESDMHHEEARKAKVEADSLQKRIHDLREI